MSNHKIEAAEGPKEVLWVYHRDQGDIEVWAVHIGQVINTLRAHGFLRIDVSKIKRG
jgi:hypothetical protein